MASGGGGGAQRSLLMSRRSGPPSRPLTHTHAPLAPSYAPPLASPFLLRSAFYTKFLNDIRDSQKFYTPQNNGSVPDCTPFYGHGGLPAGARAGARVLFLCCSVIAALF